MATYNSTIDRTADADALIPVEYASEIVKTLPQQSAAMRLFKHVPMSSKTERIPVMSALPLAYFVNGDTGLKQTTKSSWKGVTLVSEPIACIVPIPDDVAADSQFDIWGEMMPSMVEAIGMALDGAIFFGTNKPASWPTDLATSAQANPPNNVVARNTASQATGGLATDLSNLYAKLEAEGYAPNGIVSDLTLKAAIRNARNTLGDKYRDFATVNDYEGDPIVYAMNGVWNATSGQPEAIVGDFTQGVLGVRADIQYKVLTESVITDSDGNIVFNLPQQDMTAMRLVARFAFAVPNPVNRRQATDANRYPFGVLTRP